jgi:hypothetical protein
MDTAGLLEQCSWPRNSQEDAAISLPGMTFEMQLLMESHQPAFPPPDVLATRFVIRTQARV